MKDAGERISASSPRAPPRKTALVASTFPPFRTQSPRHFPSVASVPPPAIPRRALEFALIGKNNGNSEMTSSRRLLEMNPPKPTNRERDQDQRSRRQSERGRRSGVPWRWRVRRRRIEDAVMKVRSLAAVALAATVTLGVRPLHAALRRAQVERCWPLGRLPTLAALTCFLFGSVVSDRPSGDRSRSQTPGGSVPTTAVARHLRQVYFLAFRINGSRPSSHGEWV